MLIPSHMSFTENGSSAYALVNLYVRGRTERIYTLNLLWISFHFCAHIFYRKIFRYVETLKGRRRFLSKINSPNSKEKSKAQRQAVNSICQVFLPFPFV